MPFKIVQTCEKGKSTLTAVPYYWESKSRLYWPPKNVKNLNTLIRDENSKPTREWTFMDCVLKRTHLPTYESAENECYIMQQYTDTDLDNNTLSTYTQLHNSKSSNIPAQSKEHSVSYDMIPLISSAQAPELHKQTVLCTATTARASSTQVSFQQNEAAINYESYAANLIQNESSTPESVPQNSVTEESTVLQVVASDVVDQILNTQKEILSKVETLIASHNSLAEQQKNMAKKIASFGVQLDTQIKGLKDFSGDVCMLNESHPEDRECFSFKPIETKQQLELMEFNLSDKYENAKLKKLLSFLCSTSEGNGITFAYKLIDTLMTRSFLIQCSWTGGSRQELSKIPLKDYKNFINFFFSMVHHWDPKFTMEQTEKFFKVVLKNAAKRLAMKNLRSSTKRVRKSKKSVSTAQENNAGQSDIEKDKENEPNAGNIREMECEENNTETEQDAPAEMNREQNDNEENTEELDLC